jgi:hypothetical protein
MDRKAFINYKDMTDDDVKRHLIQADAYDALHMARSPYCPPYAFRELTEWPDTEVRAAMARRQGREAGTISRVLWKDKEMSVVEGVAVNPWSDKLILTNLTRHKVPYIAQIAAENPSTPGDAVDDYYLRKWSR